MHPFLLGLALPFAIAIMVGWLIYSPFAFCGFLVLVIAGECLRQRSGRTAEPILPERKQLPPADPDAEARRVMRPANGDVAPLPRTRRSKAPVGPPMKLPKGGVL